MNVDVLKARAAGTLRAFSPSQLVIASLLLVLGLTGAMFFLRWVSAPTYGVLLAGLDAKDAAAVTAKLAADGVPYKLEGGGSTVLVPQSDVDKERIAVAAAGLPAGTTQDGWAAFDKQGLTSSSFQQQVAYQRALEATLSGTLQEIEGVRSAQVHLALPEKRLFSENQEPARASVLVQTSGTLSDDTVDAMTHLVASAVPSMAPKDVSISDSNGTLLTAEGSSSGKVQATRNAYEDELSAQVTSMFDTLLGPGHAVVRVTAEMDTSSTTVDSQVYDPQKAVVLSESNTTETYAPGSTETPNGPLTSTNATGELPTGSTTTSSNGYTKTESSATRGVSVTTSHEVKEPGGVKRLSVAVAVDSNAKNAPSAEDIEAMVAGAVGLNPARGDSISVTTPAFLVAAEEKDAEAAGAASSPIEKVQDYGPKGLAALLLLFVGLGFFRAVKNGTSTELSSAEVNAAVAAGRRSALPAGSVPGQRGSEDVLGAIEGRTDEVAGVLRGWLETTSSR